MARQIFCTLLAAALLCVALPGVLSSQNGTSFRAYYDDLGQLTTIVYPNGDVINYSYDAVGNILSISKTTLSSPGALAIFNVTPLQGAPGTPVTIQGQGFSTTPANDTLQFNSTAATVTSATAITLVTTVPNAATTGPISVTVGGVTAQGPVFTVLPGLAIAPTSPSIPLGSSKQFTATQVFSDGTMQDVTTTVTWSSSNQAATISNATGTQGLATSVAAGTTTITATSGVRTASTTLTVTPPVAVSLAVTPANFSVFSGLTVQYTAILTFTDGTTQDATASATWSSSNTAVATISNTAGSQGLASALANGTTTIRAVSGALSDSTSLIVSSASQAVSRFAYVPGAGGTVSIYTVNPATGDLRPNGYVNNISGIFSGGLSSFIRVVAVDPTGRFVYVGNPASANISAYTLDPATAGLAPVPGSPFQGTNQEGRGISIHPTGKFLYDSSGGGPSVFSIDQGNGALTSLGSLLVPGGTATSTTLHPSGKFLYVPANANNSIVGYTVDPLTGMLTQFAGAPPSAGSNPFDLAVDPAGKFAYAVNFGSNNVSAYTIDPVSGALTQVTGSPFAAGNNPISATVDPLSKFLYVANSAFVGSPNVSAYTINSATGALVPVPGSPFAAGTVSGSLVDVTVDPGGKFLYVVDQSGFVSIFSIDPTNGALALLKFIEARPSPLAIAISKGTAPVTYTPKFAYVANSGSNNISAYTIDPASGALTAVSGSPFPAGMQPGSISVHPNGKFAYAVNTVDQTISAYSIDPTTGALAQIGQPIAEGQVGAGAVMIDPSGQFLYVVNTNVQGSQGSVSAYQINSASGALTPITGSPFTAPFGAGINPVSMAIDPQGTSLLVANSGSNDVLGFQIAPLGGSKPAGALTAIGNPPAVPAGTKPVSVAVGPTVTSSLFRRGPVFYVANSGSGDISIYIILAGGVVQAGSTTVGPNPQALVVDLSGKFLYVAGGTSGSPGNVSAFSINPSTGALTAISGSSVPVGTGPLSITLDFSGQFLYVTNSGSNNVSVFKIDSATGALAAVTGSPFPAGTTPKSVTTTGTIQ